MGYIESLITIIPLNGIKIGLSNVVILFSVFFLDAKSTYIIASIKSILNAIIFTGVSAIIYSLPSIICAVTVMIIIKKYFFPKSVSEYGISVLGSVVFNVVQIMIASAVMKTQVVFYYLNYMILLSVLTGIIVAFITKLINKRIRG